MNKLTDKTTRLYITDHADPSVGMFPCTWVVEVPFFVTEAAKKEYAQKTIHHLNYTQAEDLSIFKQFAIDLYRDYCDGKCTAYYDFELED
jgi:hypothetical protein